MSRISPPTNSALATVSLALIAMFQAASAAEPQTPDDEAVFRAAAGLFDARDAAALGLKTIEGAHATLFRATDEGYKFCHHPNLVVFGDQLYCMWSNGVVDEDAPGQRILYARTSDGQAWEEPVVLTEHERDICVAAGFHVAADQLIAYYTLTGGENFHPDTALMARTSRDGDNWDEPQRIADGFYIEGPRVLETGRLLLAGEHVGESRQTHRMRLLYTDDAGGLNGWQAAQIDTPQLDVFGYCEPSFFHRSDGAIVATFRNDSGHLYASVSSDGRSWSVPTQTNFPDSTARTSAGNLPDGTAYLINNPLPKQFDRSLLTIALSEDGRLFDRAFVVRGEPTKRRFDGQHKLDGWQYPHAAVWNGDLYIAYSINKEDLGVTCIDLERLAAVETRKQTALRRIEPRLVKQHELKQGAATQGLALSAKHYFTSTAGSIFRYDANWNLLQEQPIRIEGVNHVGAIDYHNGFVWAGLLHGPEGGKHDPKLDRSIIGKIRADDLQVVKTWDLSDDITWIDPVCFDGEHLWVGDLSDLGIHRYKLDGEQLTRDGVVRYPKQMHFSQGIRIVGDKLYTIHTFGDMDGLFEFDLPETLGGEVQQPARVWSIPESQMHLEGFDFVPGEPTQIWHAQGSQVDCYELPHLEEGHYPK